MASHPKAATRATEGLLLVDKPSNVTSHDVVALVRRVLGVRRVGHAGTLDPIATGLLVVFLGRGTRLIPYIDSEPKVYEATIRFGAETDTDDAAGTVIRTAAPPGEVAVLAGIASLTGDIDQVPPAYSAKKVEGTRAYTAARRGARLELVPSRVTVHRWDVLGRRGSDYDVRITCSGGTYIRALSRDLGRSTGSAAHLSELRRIQSGPFLVDNASTLEEIRDGRLNVLPLRDAIPSLPIQELEEEALARVLHGNPVSARTVGERVALIDPSGELVGIGERTGNDLQPRLVLRDA
jgi:tRNA pseudouridine55 synthase